MSDTTPELPPLPGTAARIYFTRDEMRAYALAAITAERARAAAPPTFVQERAQLEQEWTTLRALMAAEESAHSAEGVKSMTTDPTPKDALALECKRLVDEQANDDGLWFITRTASEDYLQRALRALHAAIERLTAPRHASDADTPMTAGEMNVMANKHGFARGDVAILNLMRDVEERYGVTGGRLYSNADSSVTPLHQPPTVHASDVDIAEHMRLVEVYSFELTPHTCAAVEASARRLAKGR